MDKENIFYKFKCKCTCNQNNKNQQTIQKHCKYQNEDLLSNMEQRTFISFSTDIVCIIAFVFFGSVIFWLAITRILIDCLKKIYHSDGCTKILVAGLFTLMFLSITTRIILNKRAWTIQLNQEKMEQIIRKNVSVVNTPAESSTIPPMTDYFKVTLKDKHLRNLIIENKTDSKLHKKFTVTIIDEKKKEIFKESKNVLLPELASETKAPPSLIISLKDIILENY